jgi:hypothetical protein
MFETLADAFEKCFFTLEYVQQAVLSPDQSTWNDIKESTGIRRGDALTLKRHIEDSATGGEVDEDLSVDPFAEEALVRTGTPFCDPLLLQYARFPVWLSAASITTCFASIAMLSGGRQRICIANVTAIVPIESW